LESDIDDIDNVGMGTADDSDDEGRPPPTLVVGPIPPNARPIHRHADDDGDDGRDDDTLALVVVAIKSRICAMVVGLMMSRRLRGFQSTSGAWFSARRGEREERSTDPPHSKKIPLFRPSVRPSVR
jgi:hypothetical protein